MWFEGKKIRHVLFRQLAIGFFWVVTTNPHPAAEIQTVASVDVSGGQHFRQLTQRLRNDDEQTSIRAQLSTNEVWFKI